jgi:hypothetical protein
MPITAVGDGFWRIGVIGSSHDLPDDAAEMCAAIGQRLMETGTVKVVHGGLRKRSDASTLAADWHFIRGARNVSGWRRRVETILPESGAAGEFGGGLEKHEQDDWQAEVFVEGALNRTKGRTRESRRFSFISSLDATIAVGGGKGTRQQLTLAAAIEQPLLPVPCFDGEARRFWDGHRAELVTQLGITLPKAAVWEQKPARGEETSDRAQEMVNALLRRLPKKAFVIMPFAAEYDTLYDLVIAPAANSWKDEVQRLDRQQMPGEIMAQIEEGIRAADYCIVVLDGLNPNVMYEAGYARALSKPLVLVLHNDGQSPTKIPFDVSGMQRIEYQRPNADMIARLREALRRVVVRGDND